jgi:hypothetical protein
MLELIYLPARYQLYILCLHAMKAFHSFVCNEQ